MSSRVIRGMTLEFVDALIAKSKGMDMDNDEGNVQAALHS